MKIPLDFSQYLSFAYLFCTAFPAITRAASHWVVTEDGKKIQAQDDSAFQMRRPYDLMSFLEQEKRAETFMEIKSQLIALKEEIETDSSKWSLDLFLFSSNFFFFQ